MDRARFNQLINNRVEFRAKGYKRPWHTLTENEQREASVLVEIIPQGPKPCEDCGDLVENRRCVIYNNRYAGWTGRRSESDRWYKECLICRKKWRLYQGSDEPDK